MCKSRNNTIWPPAVVSEGKYLPFRWYWGSFVQFLKLNVNSLLNFHCDCKLVTKNKPTKQNKPQTTAICLHKLCLSPNAKTHQTIFLTGNFHFLPSCFPSSLPLSPSLFLFLSCGKCIMFGLNALNALGGWIFSRSSVLSPLPWEWRGQIEWSPHKCLGKTGLPSHTMERHLYHLYSRLMMKPSYKIG